MLSTKDMSAGSGKIKPVVGPGNHTVKINEIGYMVTPYDPDSHNIILHVETTPIKGGGYEQGDETLFASTLIEDVVEPDRSSEVFKEQIEDVSKVEPIPIPNLVFAMSAIRLGDDPN